MSFSNVHFILFKPQLSENIGACARALKNFKFSNLSIVSPKVPFPNDKIIATSVGAKDIIKSTKVYNDFKDSIKEFNYIIATTNRRRNKNYKYLEIENLKKVDFKKKVAIVFGPESSGLSNNEISYANYVVKIPTNPNFQSLNISHSVIIFCFELFKLLNKDKLRKIYLKKNKLSKKKDIIKFINFLTNSLDNVGFLQPIEKRKSMLHNLSSIFLKMELSEKEIRILSSVFGTLIKKKG